MRKLTGAAFVSLDGVMQAPGGPSEDWTQGFPFGGWMFPLGDESVDEAIGGLFNQPFDLLLGRKTYEIFAAYWPYADPDFPITRTFNQTTKHVLTHSDAPLDWEHSNRVATIEGVADVKASAGPDLVIQGSSTLYPQLLAAGLIDRLIVMTFPVILGQGKRLFGASTPPLTLALTDHKLGSKGVMVATYEPAGEVVTGSFGTQEPSEREKARQERMKREG